MQQTGVITQAWLVLQTARHLHRKVHVCRHAMPLPVISIFLQLLHKFLVIRHKHSGVGITKRGEEAKHAVCGLQEHELRIRVLLASQTCSNSTSISICAE